MRMIFTIGFLVCSVAVFGQTASEYFSQGKTACNNGNYQEALKLFDKAIQLDDNDKYKYNWRGFTKGNLGQYENAIKDYDKTIQIDPNYSNPYNGRGLAKHYLKQYEDAILDYKKAIQIDLNHKDSYNNLAFTYNELGDYDEALKYAKKAIKLNSNDGYAYNNLAYAYHKKGNHSEAKTNFDKAINLKNDVFVLYFRGIYYFDLAKYDLALKDFEKIQELNKQGNAPYKSYEVAEKIRQIKKTNSPTVNNNLVLVWLTPNPDVDNYKTYETETINISIRAVGNANLSKEDFIVYRNGSRIYSDKNGEISLRGKTFSTKVKLQEGSNRIYVKVNGVQSSTIVAKYNATKPDLYLVTIAPNYQQTNATSSLKYTDDDARDIQRMYQSQGNKGVFRNVETISLIGSNAEASDINKTMERLKTQYQLKKIKPQDVVLIYISSHGYVNLGENGTFYIKGDDYDPLAKAYTSVSAKAMMNQLANIKCKKLLFLDACYSGGFRDDDERRAVIETIEELTKKQNGIATFTSSSGTQKSYEHASWNNGAFTEALLEALNGQADSNYDRKITLRELETYLEKRVPRLVRTTYNEIQTPKLYINGLSKDLPIFVY
ncbi:MAG: tetratricopeptide repeat protein [Saprospiraceae bacterium]